MNKEAAYGMVHLPRCGAATLMKQVESSSTSYWDLQNLLRIYAEQQYDVQLLAFCSRPNETF